MRKDILFWVVFGFMSLSGGIGRLIKENKRLKAENEKLKSGDGE